MRSRRAFLKKMAGLPVVTSPFFQAVPGTSSPKSERAPYGSLPRNGRKRRIIVNNDGGDLYGPAYQFEGFPPRLESVDQFLEMRLKPMEGTPVDSLFYLVYANEAWWEFPSTNIAVLGPDPLKPVVDFAREKGFELVFSIRMNDIHSAFMPGPALWKKFKVEHPELLLANVTHEEFEKRFLPWIRGDVKEHPLGDVQKRFGVGGTDFFSWAAYDYARPEVRGHFLGIVNNICQRYDVDGIELDWCRNPFYFKFGTERRNIPVMTDFVRQLRQRVQHYSQKRGRPILLAMRVPDSLASALSVGLDVESWVRERLLDLLVPGGGYKAFSLPIGEWVRLGHQHGIPVYGCISRSSLYKPESFYAAAYRFWDEGVNGIYTFNFFDPKEYGILRAIADPSNLRRLNKIYEIDVEASAGYMNRVNTPDQLPLEITTQAGPSVANLNLQIADRPERAKRVAVQVKWKQGTDLRRVSYALNGQPLANPQTVPAEIDDDRTLAMKKIRHEGYIEYETKALRKGPNTLLVKVQPPERGDASEPTVLERVRVSIIYS